MAALQPALYLLQVKSALSEEGCPDQHVQSRVKWYLVLVVFFRQFFAGHIFELCVFIQSQSGSTWEESTRCLSSSLALS